MSKKFWFEEFCVILVFLLVTIIIADFAIELFNTHEFLLCGIMALVGTLFGIITTLLFVKE